MKKLVMSIVIGLGLVIGFGAMSSVSANECDMHKCSLCEEMYCMSHEDEYECSECACGIEVFELEVDYIAEHKEEDGCEDPHILCENCGAFFCLTEDCWCGEYEVNEHYVYEEIFMNEVSVMSVEEYYTFEEMIFDMFLEEYCTNYCAECDCYYYEICNCELACSECNESVECDFNVFILDHYEIIIDIYEEVLRGIQEERMSTNEVSGETNEIIMCEF